jgi:hypothetical protein
MSRTRGTALVVALVAGLSLAACGEDGPGSAADPSGESTSTPSETPTEEPSETPTEEPSEEPMGPACADVWVAGATLPAKYDGCQDAEKGKWVQAMVYHCSSGQRLVTYRTTFYAAKGEVVNESKVPLRRNRDFQKVLASCGA